MSAFHSAVTTITHNIPSILRDPAVALIGEKCYKTLVWDFDITNVECLKYALSKGLGLGIVIGGGIVKIPQIIKIVSSSSARGLSLPAYILETISYAISLAYASRNKFPFSTYGENFFLTIQNVIITLLIIYFSGPSYGKRLSEGGPVGNKNVGKVVGGLAVTAATGFVLWSESLCPPNMLQLLQAVTLPLSLLSKAPQIISNHKNKSTGNLSAFAVFNALLGCLARLFTTKQEVNDPLIFWGFAGAAILNAVLVGQMLVYWKNSAVGGGSYSGSGSGSGTPGSMRRLKVEEGSNSPLLEEVAGGGVGGKRWTRKLD